jgi:hypothetical protein
VSRRRPSLPPSERKEMGSKRSSGPPAINSGLFIAICIRGLKAAYSGLRDICLSISTWRGETGV